MYARDFKYFYFYSLHRDDNSIVFKNLHFESCFQKALKASLLSKWTAKMHESFQYLV